MKTELLKKLDSMKETASSMFTKEAAKVANMVLDNVKVHVENIYVNNKLNPETKKIEDLKEVSFYVLGETADEKVIFLDDKGKELHIPFEHIKFLFKWNNEDMDKFVKPTHSKQRNPETKQLEDMDKPKIQKTNEQV